jgi:glycine amidinotransferase/scyllo-inosamine-4-phosphate amidinotransferase 1
MEDKMKCNNDWDTLKEIIVGTAKGYRTPELNRSFKSCQFPEYDEESIPIGSYPDWVIEETEEDLDTLAKTLTSHDVVVHRPDLTHNHSDNWHHYSPRDCTLIVGDTIIETPSPILNRQYETWGYRNIFNSLHERGYKWIKAPIPILFDENFKKDVKGVPSLNNEEILFEAANCVRVNDDILFQVSNTGNEKGARWLQDVLGDKYKVHLCKNLYSYAHLDSTIIPLREGLVMYNASRVTEENEPDLFKSWDKIWIDECHSSIRRTNLPWGASEWIGLNMLSINPHLAIVDKKQKEMINKLKEHKIEIIPLELRHDRLLAGGFHCVTLDLVRDD